MSNPLITAAELPRDLSRFTVLDVRYQMGRPSGPEVFEAGHIPGAAYVDLDTDLAAAPGEGGRHPLPDIKDFEQAMRRVGVGNARPVVVYDDWAGRAAARAWWLLRFHGHPDVRVLDGGWSNWSGETVAGPTTPIADDFTAKPGQMKVLDVDDVLSFANQHTLIDARNPERYRGEVEPVDPVAGHIPGAINVPTGANLNDDGTFRSADELRSAYPQGELAAYCGSGVTAAHDVLALASIGIDAALYPGSWSGWVTDPGRPVATGSEA